MAGHGRPHKNQGVRLAQMLLPQLRQVTAVTAESFFSQMFFQFRVDDLPELPFAAGCGDKQQISHVIHHESTTFRICHGAKRSCCDSQNAGRPAASKINQLFSPSRPAITRSAGRSANASGTRDSHSIPCAAS